MEHNIASAALATDTQSLQLIQHLEQLEQELGFVDSVVYYEYPLFRDTDDVLYRSKVLLTTRSHGVLLFGVDAIEGPRDGMEPLLRLDDETIQLHSIILGKCLKSRLLRRRPGQLTFAISTLLYLPNLGSRDEVQADVSSPVMTSLASLRSEIADLVQTDELSRDEYLELRSILEGAKGMVKARERDVSQAPPNSLAMMLRDIESEIHSFDSAQRKAAISIVNGPQRIRGLAGTGKTVVLAMKAAHLHLQDPTRAILVTFYTKSLYSHIRRLITRFYRQFSDRDPDWTRLHVLHAWGGKGVGGVYFNAAIASGVVPLTYGAVKDKTNDPFSYVVNDLLKTAPISPEYDYVLMDEAQDFPSSFFKLCFQLCKGASDDRNVVWAYDELQNIISVAVKSPRELFGELNGAPLMDLARAQNKSPAGMLHDIVLKKSYRNPRPVLVCAHALGFGLYSDTIVQMLENKKHWEDVGYAVIQGGAPHQNTVIERPLENSPLSIANVQSPEQLIRTHVAGSLEAEIAWIISEIAYFLQQGLRPDDIMVIALDDINARTYFRMLSRSLAERAVKSNDVLSDPFGQPAFIKEDHVTLSTVYRAKGNEAAVVFAIGIDAIAPGRKLRRARNKLFTAFTRAKGWLRVSGVGDGATNLMQEVVRALALTPRLEFLYPNPADVETLQREFTDRQARLQEIKETLERDLGKLGLSASEQEEYLQDILSPKK